MSQAKNATEKLTEKVKATTPAIVRLAVATQFVGPIMHEVTDGVDEISKAYQALVRAPAGTP